MREYSGYVQVFFIYQPPAGSSANIFSMRYYTDTKKLTIAQNRSYDFTKYNGTIEGWIAGDNGEEADNPSGTESDDLKMYAEAFLKAIASSSLPMQGKYTESGDNATLVYTTYEKESFTLNSSPAFSDSKIMCTTLPDITLIVSGPKAVKNESGSRSTFTPTSFTMKTTENGSATIMDMNSIPTTNYKLSFTNVSGTVSGLVIGEIDTGVAGTVQNGIESTQTNMAFTATTIEGTLEKQ